MRKKLIVPILIVALCMSGCSAQTKSTKDSSEDSQTDKTYTCDEGDSHAIEADGNEETYQNVEVKKTGDSEGDDADFYGSNAAVFATNGATLNISDSQIKTDGVHANGAFSYGEGTTLNISNSTIETEKATSGGVMVTGGGTLNATNLTVTTKSGSSAPIRSDRGGGQLNVKGGDYKSYGSGSPVIYSTAEINVEDATLYADIAEAVVVEGKNSVTITNSDVTGKNTTHNSDKADVYRNVMIYQSMSGDSEEGKGEFTMKDGNLTARNGVMFFVTNTIADINLENVNLEYASDDLLRIEKAGWGNEGSNGGQVTFNATKQSLNGNIIVDDISTLNMYLKDGSSFEGSIASEGKCYVELDSDSIWTLTADTEIDALTCDEDSIKLNGHVLKVNGKVYGEGTKSKGDAIEITVPTSTGMDQMPPGDGNMEPPEKPEGMNDGKKPPEKPEGMNNGEEPPEKPEGMNNGEELPEKPEGMNNGEEPPEKPGDMKNGTET